MKLWKTISCLSAGTPMPVSRTENLITAACSFSCSSVAWTATSPAAVNLMALPARLVST